MKIIKKNLKKKELYYLVGFIFFFFFKVDGNWVVWIMWILCMVMCGGGIKDRVRICINFVF